MCVMPPPLPIGSALSPSTLRRRPSNHRAFLKGLPPSAQLALLRLTVTG